MLRCRSDLGWVYRFFKVNFSCLKKKKNNHADHVTFAYFIDALKCTGLALQS